MPRMMAMASRMAATGLLPLDAHGREAGAAGAHAHYDAARGDVVHRGHGGRSEGWMDAVGVGDRGADADALGVGRR